jgi:hypothetical protein
MFSFYQVLNSCEKRRDPVVCVVYGLLWCIATGGVFASDFLSVLCGQSPLHLLSLYCGRTFCSILVYQMCANLSELLALLRL